MIYIIHEEENDNFKIGYTKNNPLSRLQSCKTHCPYPVSLLGTFPGDIQKEKELHQRFFSNRTRYNGEWFAVEKNEMINLILEQGGELYTNKVEEKQQDKKTLGIIQDLLTKVKVLEGINEHLKEERNRAIEDSRDVFLKKMFDSNKVSKIQKRCSHSFSTYLYLLSNKDINDEISVGSRKIASSIGVTADTALKAIKILIDEELIRITASEPGQRPIYKVLLQKDNK